jgi:hypothetical protein
LLAQVAFKGTGRTRSPQLDDDVSSFESSKTYLEHERESKEIKKKEEIITSA